MNLYEVQTMLTEAGLDGWLLYDFRGINPIAARVAGLPPEGIFSRRWAYWIPAQGEPAWLVHAIETAPFQGQDTRVLAYVSWQQLSARLRELIGNARRIAMEYSPHNAIPYVSRVDAGSMEMIRALGVEVVSSADLVQAVEACWTPEQLEGHRKSAAALMQIKDATFAWIADQLRAGRAITEYDAQQEMMRRFADFGLVSNHPPMVSVNANSGNPHYLPSPERHAPIRVGDFVLLDLWAKQSEPGAVYADITWVGFLGKEVPERYTEIFRIVARARDAALALVQERITAGQDVCGYEVDDAARGVIEEAGYGEYFIHRTGHSLGQEGHGNGVNMDNLETQDRRKLIPGIGFTIEPGIYLPEFGVRSEIDVYVGEGTVKVTTLPLQTDVLPLL
ncbi:MAG TPA: aminopeptidase P family protein [Anaerolineae bacterium]|nr:aminopeptidase P family protein [Anaerolineae bacterium]